MVEAWAVLDSNGWLVNVILWDGDATWSPPPGCTVEPYDPVLHQPMPEVTE